MEHRVIHNLKAVNEDKSLFKQWHQKFPAALGQFQEPYEEVVRRLARDIDLGNELDVVMSTLRAIYGETLNEASGDIWKVLLDKAEAEAYDKIKMIAQGEGIKA